MNPENLDFGQLTRGRAATSIPRVEQRGITCDQLSALSEFLKKHSASEQILEVPREIVVQKVVQTQIDFYQEVIKHLEVPQIIKKVIPGSPIVEKIVQVPQTVETPKIVTEIVEVPKIEVQEKLRRVPVEVDELPILGPKPHKVSLEQKNIKSVEVPVVVEQEQIVEVPTPKTVEKIVEIPVPVEQYVSFAEKVVEVPTTVHKVVPITSKRVVEVPKIVIREKLVEVPTITETAPMIKCPAGHVCKRLVGSPYTGPFSCDICGQSLPLELGEATNPSCDGVERPRLHPKVFLHCAACNYDICARCAHKFRKVFTDLVGWREIGRDGIVTDKTLQLLGIDLYQVLNWIIKPMTRKEKCSFVEKVAEKIQNPVWFVSHWWGEAVLRFIECVKKHAETRGLPGNTAYWVCAYANNQHKSEDEIGSDPAQSSFRKAMKLSIGVLLILDETGPATPFNRIWCCYEESVVVLGGARSLSEKPSLMLDIAATREGRPELLTDGLTEAEQGMQSEADMVAGWLQKQSRESTFPLDVLTAGFHIDIARAACSVPLDKTRILNSIAGRGIEELDLPYFPDHGEYQRTNRTLQGIFAVAALQASWRQGQFYALEVGINAALQQDVYREELRVDFSGCQDSMSTIGCLSFPPNLKRLELIFTSAESLWYYAVRVKLQELRQLESLSLSFINCGNMEPLQALGSTLMSLQTMTMLVLRLDYSTSSPWGECPRCPAGHSLESETSQRRCALCSSSLSTLRCAVCEYNLCDNCKTRDAEELWRRIAHLHALRHLELSFEGRRQEHGFSVHDLGRSLQCLVGLNVLKLNFKACAQLATIDRLGRGMIGHQSLRSLDLNFRHCQAHGNIAGLCQALPTLHHLQRLALNLGACPGLDAAALEDLARALAHLRAIRSLSINFDYSEAVATDAQLGASLEALANLEELTLSLKGCSQLASVDRLSRGLVACCRLTSLTLCLSSCTRLSSVSALGRCLASLSSLTELTLDLQLCTGLPGSLATIVDKARCLALWA